MEVSMQKRMCECKKYKMKIIKEGVDAGSKMKEVRRGRGKTKAGEKKTPSIRLIKIKDPVTQREPYVIYARCENRDCPCHVVIRGKNKAEAHRRFSQEKNHG
jgi:hypothetical protein